MGYMAFSRYVMTYKMFSDENLSKTGQKKQDKSKNKKNRVVV